MKQYRIPLFWTLTVVFWFSVYTYVPTLSTYLQDLGASPKMIGIIVGSYGFTQMILRIPLGILSDRMQKRKAFIILGVIFALISGAGLFAAQNIYLILIFRGFAGLAASAWVSFTVLYSSYYEHHETTKAIGTLTFFNNFGQMAGMLVGSILVEVVSMKASFLFSLIFAVVALILSFLVIEKFEAGPKVTWNGVLLTIKEKNLLLVAGFALVIQFLTFATVYGFTPIYADGLGATSGETGVMTVVTLLPSALAALLGGRVLGKMFGEKRLIITGFIIMGLFTLLIPFTRSFGALTVTQVFSGIGRGLAFTVLTSLSIKTIPSERRSTAMGFYQGIYGFGMFIGPVVMGIIDEFLSLKDGFLVFGCLGLSAALLFLALYHEPDTVM